jgi:P-type E1-E2 ATPase
MVDKMVCVKEICVDKTGTITNNDMQVVAVWCEDKVYEKVSDLKGAAKNNKKK